MSPKRLEIRIKNSVEIAITQIMKQSLNGIKHCPLVVRVSCRSAYRTIFLAVKRAMRYGLVTLATVIGL